MHNGGDTQSRNLHKKLAQFSCASFLHQIFVQVHASFLYGIELCCIRCKKLVQEKSCSRNRVRGSSFVCKSTCTSFLYKFLDCVSPPLVGLTLTYPTPDSGYVSTHRHTAYNCYTLLIQWFNDCRQQSERVPKSMSRFNRAATASCCQHAEEFRDSQNRHASSYLEPHKHRISDYCVLRHLNTHFYNKHFNHTL